MESDTVSESSIDFDAYTICVDAEQMNDIADVNDFDDAVEDRDDIMEMENDMDMEEFSDEENDLDGEFELDSGASSITVALQDSEPYRNMERFVPALRLQKLLRDH